MMEEEVDAHDEEDADHGELDEDDGGVEVCGFLDAEDEHGGDAEDGEERDEIADADDVREAGGAHVHGQRHGSGIQLPW